MRGKNRAGNKGKGDLGWLLVQKKIVGSYVVEFHAEDNKALRERWKGEV